MSESDLVAGAVGELYAADPDEFVERRSALAAQARSAGNRDAAKAITALRRPTRSAWIVNQLVRSDPTVPDRLATMGADLRASEAGRDGARIRELSLARRDLVDSLVRQAAGLAGQGPSATVLAEVTGTLAAAITDPEFAAALAAGTLTRPEQRAGFGAVSADTELNWVVPSQPRATTLEEAPAHSTEVAKRKDAERKAAEALRALRAAAAKDLASKTKAAEAAMSKQRRLEAEIRQIEQQLAAASQRLTDAEEQAAAAVAAQRAAQDALDQLS